MRQPQFVIQIATNSLNTKVICNDEDISSAIHRIEICQTAGEVPIIRLELIPQAKVNVKCEPILELIAKTETKPSKSAS